MLGSVSGSILAARALISAKNLKECNKERRLMELSLQKSYWNVQVNFSRKQK